MRHFFSKLFDAEQVEPSLLTEAMQDSKRVGALQGWSQLLRALLSDLVLLAAP